MGFNFLKLCKGMNNIQIFNNEQFGKVRIAMNKSNEPMFAGIDIANILGYENPQKAIRDHVDEEDISYCQLSDFQGVNESLPPHMKAAKLLIINESGVYSLIIRSNLPNAKQFKKWITNEVLPSIRKNGMYATDMTIERMIANPDFAIQLLTNLKEEKQKRLEAEKKIYKDAPKVLFADAVSTSQRSCLVAELAKILQQNGVNIGQNRLFSWMRENGYLCQKGHYYNQPTQKAMELGLFEIKQTTITKPDGSVLVTTTTKVTGKGQIYFVDRILHKRSA